MRCQAPLMAYPTVLMVMVLQYSAAVYTSNIVSDTGLHLPAPKYLRSACQPPSPRLPSCAASAGHNIVWQGGASSISLIHPVAGVGAGLGDEMEEARHPVCDHAGGHEQLYERCVKIMQKELVLKASQYPRGA